jgi:hypothetical protein
LGAIADCSSSILCSSSIGVSGRAISVQLESKKDQKQWVRDQKTGEWKELLVKLRDAECQIPVVFQNKHWSEMFNDDSLLADLRDILPHLRNNVFIDQSIQAGKCIELFEQFLSEGAEKIAAIVQKTKEIDRCQQQGGNLPNDADPKENIKWAILIQERENDYSKLSTSFHGVCEKLRATKSLDLESSVY